MELVFKVLVIVIMVLLAVHLFMDIVHGYKQCSVTDRVDDVEEDIKYLEDFLDEVDLESIPTIKESIDRINKEREHFITALKGLHDSIRIVAAAQGVVIPPYEAAKGTGDGYPSN